MRGNDLGNWEQGLKSHFKSPVEIEWLQYYAPLMGGYAIGLTHKVRKLDYWGQSSFNARKGGLQRTYFLTPFSLSTPLEDLHTHNSTTQKTLEKVLSEKILYWSFQGSPKERVTGFLRSPYAYQEDKLDWGASQTHLMDIYDQILRAIGDIQRQSYWWWNAKETCIVIQYPSFACSEIFQKPALFPEWGPCTLTEALQKSGRVKVTPCPDTVLQKYGKAVVWVASDHPGECGLLFHVENSPRRNADRKGYEILIPEKRIRIQSSSGEGFLDMEVLYGGGIVAQEGCAVVIDTHIPLRT